ncbi:hypothetical protein quinque_016476 [Culex quinquefasciatus]
MHVSTFSCPAVVSERAAAGLTDDLARRDIRSIDAMRHARVAPAVTVATSQVQCGDGNDKLSVLPASTTGSLSSIITTSVASSEPDRGDHRDGGVGGGGDDDDNNVVATSGGKCLGGGGPGGHGGLGEIKQEKWWETTLQISIPFFIAGIGTIGAGIILGRVEHWKVFAHVTELFILVPALLGLKGNLDMCLASRLSTQANLGNMTGYREIVHMIVGNIALVQVQATVAAFIVSVFAIGVGAAMNGRFLFDHAMLLTASSMFTATSSCFVLDFVLVAVILLSNKLKMNPDNLATPLAASIGDVVSISLLSFIASLLFEHLDTHLWITFVVARIDNWMGSCTVGTLYQWIGWSSVGYRSRHLQRFYVVFQPIINGIGGNLVSVQASKISTMLHQSSIFGIVPPHAKIFEAPWKALFKGVPYAKTARILILMSIPGQVLFIYVADYIHMSESTIGAPFVLSYLLVSLIQIMLLLYIAHVIIHAMWKWKIDPDNSAIPYLTALGDLLGSSLLALAFLFIQSIGHPYGDPW